MAEALRGIDVVYHLISTTVPSTSNLDPVYDIESNLIGTLRLLQQMINVGVKRIVFISSGGTIYGEADTIPTPELHKLRPICSYGAVKLAIESYLFVFHKLYGISPVILRPSNTFGPNESHPGVQGLISTTLLKLKNNEKIHIWGDGSAVRDYVYVEDLVKLCVLSGKSEVIGEFNVGSGIGYTVNEIIKTIEEVTHSKPDVVYDPNRPFDVRKVILDISKAQNTFGWKPQVSLKEGIQRTWDWMKGKQAYLK